MALKIAHMADVHLDSDFLGLPPHLAAVRRGDMIKSFDRAIDVIKAERADILIIAGDLFEEQSVLKSTINHVSSKLGELYPVPVFIAPGNHDPHTHKSYYRIWDWPDNVHIFDQNLYRFDIDALNVSVYGKGFDRPYIKEPALDGFKVEDSSRVNIMAIHGDIGEESIYNPIRLKDIENSGLAYLALGHIHTRTGLKRTGKTSWCYPGNIEGRDFGECGPRGFVMCTLEGNQCSLEFFPVNTREYTVVDIDITDMPEVQEIVQRVEQYCRNNVILRVFLKGVVEEQYKEGINIPFIVDQLNRSLKDGLFYVDIVDETEVDIDLDALTKDVGIKGLYARKMKQILQEAQEDEIRVVKEALRIGIKALGG
ncbi:DNA repair exonuclease SbcCD nuclease subunit [Caldanaerobius fijiensis DSM 17918]|uniref:DNA repair exonuclease SbcCD nuclease subunit n=1 Tax=Caldanaerobius fijiensis DSM 17918 TaxID=1121256 RepID=A0A1M5C1G8_9THEO|nr:metallophosphoesterase [Caldanaerobius fijiensis]SHF48510.1 DNA repair exonuclease SbcCD nuclease subunit [Caldanaerobius fijiensis DSM 17918]